MLDASSILLGEADVADSVPEIFFPGEVPTPDLACSALDAMTSFTPLEDSDCGQKRPRCEDEEEEVQLNELQTEVKRLKDVNHYLQASFTCIQDKTDSAIAEQSKLLSLVDALHAHKRDLQLRPLASARSSIASCEPADGATTELFPEDPTETFLALPQSPSRSQPGPAEPSMTPCKDERRVQSAALPSQRGGLPSDGSKLPAKLEEDPRTACSAAVAAAALVINNGNPAGALLDLLRLAMRRRMAQITA